VTDKQTNKQTNKKTKRQTRPRSSAGNRPPLPKFSGYVEVEAHYIFHPSTIWVQPLFTELGPKKKTQKADFAMKQTNICRLSCNIINYYSQKYFTVCLAMQPRIQTSISYITALTLQSAAYLLKNLSTVVKLTANITCI